LPQDTYPTRYIVEGRRKTAYAIVIAGRNFGCGSSREHAPIALGAAGCQAVVAEGFARIFFRNCVATGELYPVESTERLCDLVQTGDQVELNLDANTLTLLKSGQTIVTKSLGDARPEYARRTGMITAQGNHTPETERLAAKEPADD
jgi:3-isopropylmalate/(R)-2-methylmalate dehydratase small subunit